MKTHGDQQHGSASSDVFWGEIAPCEHLVQLYQDNGVLLDSLAGFVGGGLRRGEGVIVIATEANRAVLDARLERDAARGDFDLKAACREDRYIAVDAQQTISKFVIDGWPDEDLFRDAVSELLDRARGSSVGRRPVRAFGEMVALLWAQGHSGAVVRLEHLWHSLCKEEVFSLFCAYPSAGFTQDASSAIADICAAHSRVVNGRN